MASSISDSFRFIIFFFMASLSLVRVENSHAFSTLAHGRGLLLTLLTGASLFRTALVTRHHMAAHGTTAPPGLPRVPSTYAPCS